MSNISPAGYQINNVNNNQSFSHANFLNQVTEKISNIKEYLENNNIGLINKNNQDQF